MSKTTASPPSKSNQKNGLPGDPKSERELLWCIFERKTDPVEDDAELIQSPGFKGILRVALDLVDEGREPDVATVQQQATIKGNYDPEAWQPFDEDKVYTAEDPEAIRQRLNQYRPFREFENANTAVKQGALKIHQWWERIEEVSAQVSAASETETIPETGPEWPTLGEAAFHGPLGEMVKAIEPHTESDTPALLVQALAAFGSIVGRGAFYEVEATRHYPNLFCVLCGATSKARKGTSFRHVKNVMDKVDPEWPISSDIASGEAIVWAVRDEGKNHDGVGDKRLFIQQSEFSSILKVAAREGNTLSDRLRDAWDKDSLVNNRANDKTITATGAHVSLCGHITIEEINRTLGQTNTTNGFGNRFLWVATNRSKMLSRGGRIDKVDFQPIVARLAEAKKFAANAGRIPFDHEGGEFWDSLYPRLVEGRPGLLGSMTSRAEAQTVRLALVYALADASPRITQDHLEAAYTLWQYCEQSARYIFGERLGNPDCEKLLEAIKERGAQGMTRAEINKKVFAGHKDTSEIDKHLETLNGFIEIREEKTRGRKGKRVYPAEKAEKA